MDAYCKHAFIASTGIFIVKTLLSSGMTARKMDGRWNAACVKVPLASLVSRCPLLLVSLLCTGKPLGELNDSLAIFGDSAAEGVLA